MTSLIDVRLTMHAWSPNGDALGEYGDILVTLSGLPSGLTHGNFSLDGTS